MKHLKPAMQISLALAVSALSVFFVAELLGLLPDRRAQTLETRRKLAEAAAVGCSIAAPDGDTDAMTAILVALVRRNEEVRSAAVRDLEGQVICQAGPHEQLWPEAAGGEALDTQARVPIFVEDKPWGQIELALAPAGGSTWFQRLRRSSITLFVFVGVGSFVAFLFVLRRTLEHLDPSTVIPERVQAMLDCLAEGVIVLDPKGRIVMANHQFARTFDCEPADLVGKRPQRQHWRMEDAGDEGGEMPWTSSLQSDRVHQIGRAHV